MAAMVIVSVGVAAPAAAQTPASPAATIDVTAGWSAHGTGTPPLYTNLGIGGGGFAFRAGVGTRSAHGIGGEFEMVVASAFSGQQKFHCTYLACAEYFHTYDRAVREKFFSGFVRFGSPHIHGLVGLTIATTTTTTRDSLQYTGIPSSVTVTGPSDSRQTSWGVAGGLDVDQPIARHVSLVAAFRVYRLFNQPGVTAAGLGLGNSATDIGLGRLAGQVLAGARFVFY